MCLLLPVSAFKFHHIDVIYSPRSHFAYVQKHKSEKKKKVTCSP